MKITSAILVAYPVGGERAALDLVPLLEPLGNVTLRKYEKVDLTAPPVDVALCVVTDDRSISSAHQLQKDLDTIPTLVVDHTAGRRIPVNGFAGLTPPSPTQIAEAVEKLLETHVEPSDRQYDLPHLTGRFDAILSRLGGLAGTTASMLAASARQLCRDLRAGRAEAWVIEAAGPKRVFAVNSEGDQRLPLGFVDAISGCTYPMPVSELTQKSDRFLREYLRERELNVVAPLRSEDRSFGWIAFQLKNKQLTDSFLDDLQIAAHLLSMSLLTTLPPKETEFSNPWDSIFSSFATGILLVDSNQQIKGLIGDLSTTGSELEEGSSIAGIRSSRIRELIVEALSGNHLRESWNESLSGLQVSCSTVSMGDGTVAVQLQASKADSVSDLVNIDGVMQSLEMPVTVEADSGAANTLTSGKVRQRDADAMRQCVASAIASKTKSLRLRFASKDHGARGVLFFETPSGEQSNLADDLTKAVNFAVYP